MRIAIPDHLMLLVLLYTEASFLFGSGFATLNPVDYLLLQSVRKSLSDLPGSSFFASWDFTADPCAFSGVFFSADRVLSLSLGDPRAGSQGLAGHLPPDIARLSALNQLFLVPGRVAGPLPPALPLGLRLLALAGNLLSGSIPANYAALLGLRTLDLNSNLISGVVPPGLVRLPELRTVILARNRLSSALPAVSSPLVRLDLQNNALSGSISSLPSCLVYLSLSSNRLSGRVDRVLLLLRRLNYLDLSRNRFSGPVQGALFTFPISSLQLQRNQFSGTVRPVGPVKVAGATVDLSYNRLKGAMPSKLAPAGKVYLNFNRFTREVPAALVEAVVAGRMLVLYLQHNYLSKLHMGAAKSVPAGTAICLRYNCMVPPAETTCPGSAGPQKAWPATECIAGWKKGAI